MSFSLHYCFVKWAEVRWISDFLPGMKQPVVRTDWVCLHFYNFRVDRLRSGQFGRPYIVCGRDMIFQFAQDTVHEYTKLPSDFFVVARLLCYNSGDQFT